MLKTLKLRILPNDEQIAALRQMTEQYRQACNFVSQYTFANGIELNSFKLQKALYADVREDFGLKAQMAVSVFRTVTARYKTVQEQLRQKPYHFKDEYTGEWYDIPKDLSWLRKPVIFRRPQVDLVLKRDYSFDFATHQLSLNTLGKRIKLDCVDGCWQDYFDGSWTFGTGKVVQMKGNWYFHIPCSKESNEELTREQVQHVVGIDRGLRFLTSTYDENGKAIAYNDLLSVYYTPNQAEGTLPLQYVESYALVSSSRRFDISFKYKNIYPRVFSTWEDGGNAAGTLSSVSVDSSGTITGTYTNGVKQTEAQVAVAQFTNASGLTKTGNSLYQESNNSGTANVKTASDLGVTITPSALEMSNVDIANEFSDMIITQRGFQSNSKIITVGDEMLETLINMKR